MTTDEKAALETSTRRASREYTTRMGVKLELEKISGLIIQNSLKKLQQPKPPIIHVPAQGELPAYDEENVSDPDYLEAVGEFNSKTGETTARLFYVLGTRIKSLPEGLDGPNGNEWVETLKSLAEVGIEDIEEIPEDKNSKLRYYYWLKYWGADENDLRGIVEAIMTLGGSPVLEAKVSESLDTFRGDETRDSDSGVSPTEQRQSRRPTPIKSNLN